MVCTAAGKLFLSEILPLLKKSYPTADKVHMPYQLAFPPAVVSAYQFVPVAAVCLQINGSDPMPFLAGTTTPFPDDSIASITPHFFPSFGNGSAFLQTAPYCNICPVFQKRDSVSAFVQLAIFFILVVVNFNKNTSFPHQKHLHFGKNMVY